jgi:hypothetical protein
MRSGHTKPRWLTIRSQLGVGHRPRACDIRVRTQRALVLLGRHRLNTILPRDSTRKADKASIRVFFDRAVNY